MYRRAINVSEERKTGRNKKRMAEWIMCGVLAGFAVYDLKWKKVKMTAVALLGAGAVLYRIFTGTGASELVLGLLPGIVLLVVSFVTKESIGQGDGMVLCILGVFCGAKQAVAILGMAFTLCALLAVILLACKRVTKKTELPFLPCLCAGYCLCLLW